MKILSKFLLKKHLAFALLMVFAMSNVSAEEKATAEDISAAVSDHTYQGSMTKSAFVEYYNADGTIKGKGYSGKWRTVDGAMCFQYGEKPETCWNVTLDGPSMVMFKDSKVDGNGMLIKGNPNKF